MYRTSDYAMSLQHTLRYRSYVYGSISSTVSLTKRMKSYTCQKCASIQSLSIQSQSYLLVFLRSGRGPGSLLVVFA